MPDTDKYRMQNERYMTLVKDGDFADIFLPVNSPYKATAFMQYPHHVSENLRRYSRLYSYRYALQYDDSEGYILNVINETPGQHSHSFVQCTFGSFDFLIPFMAGGDRPEMTDRTILTRYNHLTLLEYLMDIIHGIINEYGRRMNFYTKGKDEMEELYISIRDGVPVEPDRADKMRNDPKIRNVMMKGWFPDE